MLVSNFFRIFVKITYFIITDIDTFFMNLRFKSGRLKWTLLAIAILFIGLPLWLMAGNGSDAEVLDVLDIITPADTLSFTITPEGDTIFLHVDPAH